MSGSETKKEHEVVGSSKALAFLFSGGHFLNVAPRLTRKEKRKKRRAAIFQGWSRGVMARLPHPLVVAKAQRNEGRVPGSFSSTKKVMAKRQAPTFAARPSLESVVRGLIEEAHPMVPGRRHARSVIRRAGYRWKDVAKRLRSAP